MTDAHFFLLFILPTAVVLIVALIVVSINSGAPDDIQRGPDIQDTFEEMSEDE